MLQDVEPIAAARVTIPQGNWVGQPPRSLSRLGVTDRFLETDAIGKHMQRTSAIRPIS
jgi:hypothetical protein